MPDTPNKRRTIILVFVLAVLILLALVVLRLGRVQPPAPLLPKPAALPPPQSIEVNLKQPGLAPLLELELVPPIPEIGEDQAGRENPFVPFR